MHKISIIKLCKCLFTLVIFSYLSACATYSKQADSMRGALVSGQYDAAFALVAEQYKVLIDNYTNELPYIPMVYAHYADCMINLGYFKSAEKALSKAIELDPSHPEVMIVQNTYLIETQNFTLALSQSEEFVQINQDCMICLLLAADNHYLVENFDRALEYYERIYQGASIKKHARGF